MRNSNQDDMSSLSHTQRAVAKVVAAYGLGTVPLALDAWREVPDPGRLSEHTPDWSRLPHQELNLVGLQVADAIINLQLTKNTVTLPILHRVAADAHACLDRMNELRILPAPQYLIGGRTALTTAMELRLGLRDRQQIEQPLAVLSAQALRGYDDVVAVLMNQPKKPRLEQDGPLWAAAQTRRSRLYDMSAACQRRRYELSVAQPTRPRTGANQDFPTSAARAAEGPASRPDRTQWPAPQTGPHGNLSR